MGSTCVAHAGLTCVLASAPPQWRPCGSPEDTAYLLFTSGTTGQPKGVFQNQRGLMQDVMQYTNSVHFSELDVTSLLYSPSVNGAIRDIYGALLNGGCLCMIDLRRDGFHGAAAQMAAAGITLLHAMPPVLRSLLRAGPIGANHPPGRPPCQLRQRRTHAHPGATSDGRGDGGGGSSREPGGEPPKPCALTQPARCSSSRRRRCRASLP